MSGGSSASRSASHSRAPSYVSVNDPMDYDAWPSEEHDRIVDALAE